EAGVERALSLLQADPNACDDNSCQASIDGIDSRVEVVGVGGNTNAFGIGTLDKDDVIQVNLDGYSSPYLLDMYWGNEGDAADCVGLAAAAVVSVVYQNGST